MTNKYNSVAEINAEKKSWRIMVRVVRLWMVLDVLTNKQTSSNKIPFSMEMVLVDSKYSTKVALVDNASVPYSAYDFVHIRDIVCGGYDTDYLVDKIHLQNCICGTRVVFNAKCEEVKELATRMMESPPQGLSQIIDSIALTMSEDFLHNTTRKTIGGLKDCFEDATILFSKSCANMFETYMKMLKMIVSVVKKEATDLSKDSE
ncbi:hypothetical protein JHK87_035077 [Glycine soja]|nr:hypothetical protein JHK87_035077 [Glycine soja]